jgi:hypothetical protein
VNARSLVFKAAMEAGQCWPLRKRIELYKALALLAGNPTDAAPFDDMANDLESADQRHRDLSLRFEAESNSNSSPS